MSVYTYSDGKVSLFLTYNDEGFPELNVVVGPDLCKEKRPTTQIKLNGVTIHEMANPTDNRWRPPMDVIQLGKYTITHSNGILTAHRNGETWEVGTKRLVGDNLAIAMIQKILELEQKLQEKNCVNF